VTWTPEQRREWVDASAYERSLPEVTLEAAAAAISTDRERRQHEAEAIHPAVLALDGHRPFFKPGAVDLVDCQCGDAGDYRSHVLDLLTAAHLLMDTRRPYTGPIPVHDPTWANETHPQGAVGAPGAVASYARRMGWTEGQASSPVEGK
jgi:hypothetical protein